MEPEKSLTHLTKLLVRAHRLLQSLNRKVERLGQPNCLGNAEVRDVRLKIQTELEQVCVSERAGVHQRFATSVQYGVDGRQIVRIST